MPLPAQTSNVHAMSDRSPAPPALVNIEDTGLAPDVIEQLLIKTLYGAEAIGIGDRRAHAPAVHDARAAGGTRPGRAAHRSAGRQRRQRRHLPVLADRPRARARPAVPRDQPVRRSDARAAGGVRRPDEGAGRQSRLHGPRAAEAGLPAPDRRRPDPREARPCGQRRQGGVPLRAARETARPFWPRAWASRLAATCISRTRSTSTGTSSRCTTPSATSRSIRRPTPPRRRA